MCSTISPVIKELLTDTGEQGQRFREMRKKVFSETFEVNGFVYRFTVTPTFVERKREELPSE